MKLSYFGLLRECQKSASLSFPRISTAIEQAGLEQRYCPWTLRWGYIHV